jgi:tetratricopeptide (TPR) repeat protein
MLERGLFGFRNYSCEQAGIMRMKFWALVLVSSLVLAGCSTPESQFEKSYSEAQLSLEQGDLDAARAQLAEALAALPDNEEGKLLESQIRVLEDIRSSSQSGNWRLAFSSLDSFEKESTAYEVGVKLAFDGLEKYLSELELISGNVGQKAAATAAVETVVSEADGITNAENFANRPKIIEFVKESLKVRIEQIESLIEGSLFEEALVLLAKLTSLSIYPTTAFDDLRPQAEPAFEKQVLDLAKQETKAGNLASAMSALDNALGILPGSTLLKAEKTAIEGLVAEANRKALAAMVIQEDSFEETKTYYDKATFTRNPSNKFELSIIESECCVTRLNLRLMMFDSDWVFFEFVKIDVDGEKFFFVFDYFDVERDNSGGNVWEWHDLTPSEEDLEMIEKIIVSKSTRIRFTTPDEKEFVERTVSSAQKQALKNVLLVYQALAGE